tara:strand:- start:22 stop:948 length:927 start_codon:yes stop_codon:yes gene_type:complete
MELKNALSEVTKIVKRSANLAPPIIKDCSYRLWMNKLTWVLIVILLLPCLLGIWSYYEFSDQRQVQEIDGEKIYYDKDTGEPLHEEGRDIFLELSQLFSIGFVGIIVAIMFSSELINEEYNQKTMNLLRTTPIRPIEILFYRYISGVFSMLTILSLASILFYVILMMTAGIHGIIEELDVLWLVIKIIILESIAYIGIFCLITIYFERPFFLGIIYWILWEGIISGQNYQKITVTHYLDSILFDGVKKMGWNSVGSSTYEEDLATEYGLINSKDEIIASEPMIAILVLCLVAIITTLWGARGIAARQF